MRTLTREDGGYITLNLAGNELVFRRNAQANPETYFLAHVTRLAAKQHGDPPQHFLELVFVNGKSVKLMEGWPQAFVNQTERDLIDDMRKLK